MKRFSVSILCALTILSIGLTAYLLLAGSPHHNRVDQVVAAEEHGSANNATVSFGGWMTSPTPLDRFPNLNPIPRNHHRLTPEIAKIKAGGTVTQEKTQSRMKLRLK